jgi:hypothetical protein
MLQLLQHACKLAHQMAQVQVLKNKSIFDLKAADHQFSIGQKVWLSNNTAIGKNANLMLK